MKEKYDIFPSHHQLSTFNTEFIKVTVVIQL